MDKQKKKRKKNASVLLIVTGGTIASSVHEDGGLAPVNGMLTRELKKYPDFRNPQLPTFDILEWEDSLDSASFNPSHWVILAKQIFDNYFDYSGFVIVHGTDTMAYTASALSFMLEGLGKPVVFTGAQIPLGELFNDAKSNLVAAIIAAATIDLPEVSICFANRLFRGNRTTKFNSWAQDAYISPNYPPLADFGINISFYNERILYAPKRRIEVFTDLFTNIAVIWLIPGFDTSIIEAYFSSSKTEDKALVLICFGSGNAPAIQKRTLDNVSEFSKEHFLTVVITSQCQKGCINLNLYKTGVELRRLGFINGMDMTTEACVTKLAYLMGKGLRGERLKETMETNIKGELTNFQDQKQIPYYKADNKFSDISRI